MRHLFDKYRGHVGWRDGTSPKFADQHLQPEFLPQNMRSGFMNLLAYFLDLGVQAEFFFEVPGTGQSVIDLRQRLFDFTKAEGEWLLRRLFILLPTRRNSMRVFQRFDSIVQFTEPILFALQF